MCAANLQLLYCQNTAGKHRSSSQYPSQHYRARYTSFGIVAAVRSVENDAAAELRISCLTYTTLEASGSGPENQCRMEKVESRSPVSPSPLLLADKIQKHQQKAAEEGDAWREMSRSNTRSHVGGATGSGPCSNCRKKESARRGKAWLSKSLD